MISIRKAASEHERQEDLLRALVRFYSQAIHASADYAIELDAGSTEQFREQLYSLHTQTSGASTTHEYEVVDKSLRRELQQYQDRSRGYLTRMRRELDAAASAMKVVAEQVSNSSGDYEVRLQQEVERLRLLSRSDNLEEIRSGIRVAAGEILNSYEQFRRSTRFTIAQLQDEIRVLHQAMESDRQKAFVDQGSGVWNRVKLLRQMEVLQEQNHRFCAMVIIVRNWRRIQGQYSRTSLNAVLQAYLKDVHAILGAEATVGRWSDDIFVAILGMDPSAGMQLSSEIKRKIPGAYTTQEKGSRETIKLETVASLVERQRDFPPDRFFVKLNQLIEALGSV